MTTETPLRMSRTTRLVLVASLGLNLIVAGFLVGAYLFHRGPPPGGIGFGPYTYALAQEDREALRRAFITQSRDTNFRGRMQEERQALSGLLRAEPFDRAAVQQLFEAQRQRADEGFRMGQSLLLDRISAMTPEARTAFAERLESGPKRSRDERRESK